MLRCWARCVAQPTMLQYKDLALNGSNNYVAVHVNLIVVLPDLDNPVGWATQRAQHSLGNSLL